jgi:hypothetical protein
MTPTQTWVVLGAVAWCAWVILVATILRRR